MKSSLIKNKKQLATNPLRQDALDIVEAGFESILTDKIIAENISLNNNLLTIKDQKYNLQKYKNIFVVAIGKCANQTARKLEEILADKITTGIALDVEKAVFKKIKSEVGSHPFPSEQNILATKSIIKILQQAEKDDLIITVISGGGSALLCAPVLGIGSENLKQITQSLTEKGVSIGELNMVRKHLSQIKGGGLARWAYPAQVASIIFSDVPGDDLSVIASGPTVLDETTVEDANIVLEAYYGENVQIADKDIISFLTETVKEQKYFDKVDNILLLTNKIALEAMQAKATELGYVAVIESGELQGEARELGATLISREYLPKTCRLWGGETTVRKTGGGKGGRNQEFVLGAVARLSKDLLILAVASDGWDNTDVAGAFADQDIFAKIKKENLDVSAYLKNNDSYNFFKKIGTQIKTGRTGVNVADFYLILKK